VSRKTSASARAAVSTVVSRVLEFVGTVVGLVRSRFRPLAQRLQDSPVVEGLARAGFVMNGILHIIIGGIAISIAYGGSGDADQGGALGSLAAQPFGIVVLAIVVLGLWGLGLFQLLEALLVRGTDGKKWAARLKEAAKGIAYLAVGSTAFAYAIGETPDSGDQSRDFTEQLLATLLGKIVLSVIALAVMAVGVYFVAKGARRRFLGDIDEPSGHATTGIVVLGIFGYIAKGIALFIVGILFGIAALTSDPSAATGLDGALSGLSQVPFGTVALTVVGAGFIAYGLYCFVRSRYADL